MPVLFAWYMGGSWLKIILKGSSRDFIRRTELDVREMLVKVGRGKKGKLDTRIEERLGEEEWGSKMRGGCSDKLSILSEGC